MCGVRLEHMPAAATQAAGRATSRGLDR
jgi:hypothetical protein